MQNGFLASLPALLMGASLVLGQPSPTPLPEATPPEGESKPAPAVPAETPPPPFPGVFDSLASHWEGTCSRPTGNILVGEIDYLLWVFRDDRLSVPLATNGAVGAPGTRVLIGDEKLQDHHRPSSGFRVSLAYWEEDPLPELNWDKPRTFAIEVNYLDLPNRGIAERADSASTLIRPFFALNNRSETGLVVAAPGIANGGVTVSNNFGMWGTELNLWKNICFDYPGRAYRFDVLAGFRYLDLGEDLSVTSVSLYNADASGVFQPFAGNQILVNDLFFTRNQFYGGQIGAVAKFFLETMELNLAGKFAFGGNAEQIHIDGFQLRTLPTGTVVPSQGGLLALPSNIGRFHHNEFCMVPEVDFTASIPICRHVTFTAGYEFIYWNRVLRPAEQIDRVIDATQIPNFPALGATPTGIARPAVLLKQSDFWAQGVVIGLQFIW
jgi:hypothetical protein